MKILYISYDGLLDPIGASQILPYIKNIASESAAFYVISFEKKDKYDLAGSILRQELENLNISWRPLIFSSRFAILGKLYDLIKMYIVSLQLMLQGKLEIVHSRGHVAGQIGSFLKLILGCKFIFDFRGLWVDERVNKGGWDISNNFDYLQYKLFKRIERTIIKRADHIIVLTEAVISELMNLGAVSADRISVIPCCADFDHFILHDESQKKSFRSMLGINSDDLILGYLGSIGSMYRFDSYIRLVILASSKDQSIRGLIVTQDKKLAQEILSSLASFDEQSRFIIVSATRDEVINYINTFDIMVNFLTTSYARLATSPTRNAESFACGIPVICNQGIGDVDMHTTILDSGFIILDFSDESLLRAINHFKIIKLKGGARLRNESKKLFALEIAEQRYKNVYFDIFTN